MVDLFGDDLPAVRTNDRREAAALVEVLLTLRAHPMVAWAERMNSGAARIGGRFVRFGWTGCPDLLGQLKDGRLLGVEVKAEKGSYDPSKVFSWSASAMPGARHSWRGIAGTCCENLTASDGKGHDD